MSSAHELCVIGREREGSCDTWLSVAAVLYMIATTVSFVSTTFSSRAFVEPVRVLTLAATVAIVLLVLLQRPRLARTTILGMIVFLVALAYGIALAVANGGMVHIVKQLYADVALTLVGIYVFSSPVNGIFPRRVVLLYLVFAAGAFALTIAVGGFAMTYPPHFSFEYAASESGLDVNYSQGLSKFFGLAAISAIFLAFTTRAKLGRPAFLCICFLSLGLSLVGGARGDSALAALVVLLYSIYRAPGSIALWIAAIGGAVVLMQGTFLAQDFVIFNRLMSLQEGVSDRGVLLRQSAHLLAEQPVCVTLGCGFGYFQSYFGHEAGMYPHNILVEAVIVWGLPIVLIAVALGVSGLVEYRSRARGNSDAFLLFYAYFMLVFLKSGTILAGWFVVAGGVTFIALALDRLLWQRGLSR